MNVARIVALARGSRRDPANDINRFCSSGFQSMASSADRIATGPSSWPGGVESMSMIPMTGTKRR